eukprot:CAMPEP_0201687462 /NCGR_PEP_ID=MMETSP0578-20130828/1515_1 /ASSEMBLY_ACC=CAM_ASM_000663 /TAXON_ID=267565 /ORGANISM="Skeletonema grethea, Strain CCMP 1804" /LENGTH=258 /DNA_ID=CAMNT_0048171621 /DNA_START=165 /DNA_END=941 /DNA_ORIENTATION=-
MADNTTQQQKTLRKLSARISAAFRIPRQPTLLERRRIEQCSNDDNRDDNRDDNSSSTAMVTAAERTQPRRRLPRGWWPDQGKREGLKLKAMYGLQNETFVVTEDHIEYIFQEEQDNDANSDTQYKINLILPTEITGRQGKQNNQCSNECSICMLEYDIGDVVVCSKHCSHVFHQECILNWFSHSNVKSGKSNKSCPSCRCNFWDVDDEKHKEEGGSLRENRPRSDTEDTSALSVNVEYSRSMGETVHEQNALLPVAED